MPKTSRFDRFDENWKNIGVKDRLIKLELCLTPVLNQSLTSYLNLYYDSIKFMMRQIYTHLVNTQTIPGKADTFGSQLAVLYKKELFTHGCFTAKFRENITISSAMKYCSYIRNKPLNKIIPKRPLSFNSSKGTFIRKAQWDDINNILNIPLGGISTYTKNNKPTYTQNYLSIPCKVLYNKELHKKEISGNLINNNNNTYIFAARGKCPINWLYVPIASLGIDINKSPQNFVTLSNNIKIPHNELIIKQCKTINTLNRLLKDKSGSTIKSKKRRHVRRAWKNVHRALLKSVSKIVNNIINDAIANKLLLCIDTANTGAKNGTYGQDKFISLLINGCENKGIPFVLVPTFFTSQRCSICGQQGKRKGEAFTCICGAFLDADINAAKNIADFGTHIWNNGIVSFKEWFENETLTYIKKKKPKNAVLLCAANKQATNHALLT
jgi:transposase